MPPRRPLKQNLRAIERAFADIEKLFAGFTKRVRVAGRAAVRRGKATAEPRRKLKLSPKRRAQRKLHGSYIGHLRHLKPAQKLRVKAVKEKKGLVAAIRVAKRIANG